MRTLQLLMLPAGVLFCAQAAPPQVVNADWINPNFALCEDVGFHASGRVRATAKLATESGIKRLRSLNIITTHTHSHKTTGSIEWTAPDGVRKTTALQAPWFDVISVPGAGQMLVLPRKGSGTGPGAQTALEIKPGTSVTIKLTLAFVTPGGTCPTSFSQNWALPA